MFCVAACGGGETPASPAQGSSGEGGGPSASSSDGDNGGVGGATTAPARVCDAGPDAKREGWDLVFCDEFSGDAIDLATWDFDIGDGGDKPAGPGWGNGEKQYYTRRSENARTEEGNLIISALKDGPHHGNGLASSYDYSSARMVTRGKVAWTFGRIEVRAKLPKGQGVWPAIWMLPLTEEYGGWAASGEIDIMELKGQDPSTMYSTLHFGNQWSKNEYVGCSYALPSGDFSQDFHVFAVEWDKTAIRFFVDDHHFETQVPRGTTSTEPVCQGADGTAVPAGHNEYVTDPSAGWHSSGGDAPAPFDQQFYLTLNVAVGGGFVGDPDPTVFPQSMTVDYVRVYQKTGGK